MSEGLNWTIEWSDRAKGDLLNLPHWKDAARVDAAVQRFAATGEGDLRRLPGVGEFLQVGRFRARVSADILGRVLHVWYVVALK
jgi:hypothetical protein